MQMKTLLLSPLSGFRRARKPSQPPHPPKRIRTSGRDLPQKEQVVHGTAIVVVSAVSSFFAEVSTPREGAGTSSVLELDVSVVGDAVSGRRVRVGRSSSAGNLATSVFQSASPNCRATISRQSLCESRTLRFPRASRRDLAIILASLCVSMILNPPYTANLRMISACITDPFAEWLRIRSSGVDAFTVPRIEAQAAGASSLEQPYSGWTIVVNASALSSLQDRADSSSRSSDYGIEHLKVNGRRTA